MSLTSRAVDLASSSGPCLHARQHHPGSPERMLPCAWPDCDVGVGEERLSLCRPDRAPPLLLERRSLVLGGAEQVFLWHPCGTQG
ncbi:MAG TPA: hypothetical protein VLT82_18160 [Myxococcaceae bacterium]|nr:hypothetical protein [Myxococcaceae bacterium]